MEFTEELSQIRKQSNKGAEISVKLTRTRVGQGSEPRKVRRGGADG